jgi:polysaccharide biosynthesis/export protein
MTTMMAQAAWRRSISLAVCCVLMAATARPLAGGQQGGAITPRGLEADYVIGPEDVLEIAVWDNEQLTRTVPVRPDGKISLPLLNDVRAGGLTPMELRTFLTSALAEYIPIPTVSVIVREVHSFKVAVMGEVRLPGRFELKSRSTVLDALALAGGLTEYASRSRIVVLRRHQTGTHQIPFDFDKMTVKNGAVGDGDGSGGKPDGEGRQHNFDVAPGDIILVP